MGEDLGDHGRMFDGGDDRQGTACGHCAMSITNTRLSNWAKLRRTGAEGWGASA
jgi:hypothetical protein